MTARLTRPAAAAAATRGTTSRGRSSTATVSPAAAGPGAAVTDSTTPYPATRAGARPPGRGGEHADVLPG